MEIPRVSIGKLMVVVVLIALNLAAGRAVYSFGPWLLAGFVPTVLVLQFGVFRLIRNRGRARVFWAGFVAGGVLAVGSLAWSFLFRTSVNIGINVTTGQKITITTPGFPAADRVWSAWVVYLTFVENCVESLPMAEDILGREDSATAIAFAVVVVLPQLLIAVSGGLLALVVTWLAGKLRRRPTGPATVLNRPAWLAEQPPPGSYTVHRSSRA